MAKGYSRIPGVDFQEVFSSETHCKTICFQIALAVPLRWTRSFPAFKNAIANAPVQKKTILNSYWDIAFQEEKVIFTN